MIDRFIRKTLIELLLFILKLHTKTNLPFCIIQEEEEEGEREKEVGGGKTNCKTLFFLSYNE